MIRGRLLRPDGAGVRLAGPAQLVVVRSGRLAIGYVDARFRRRQKRRVMAVLDVRGAELGEDSAP